MFNLAFMVISSLTCMYSNDKTEMFQGIKMRSKETLTVLSATRNELSVTAIFKYSNLHP